MRPIPLAPAVLATLTACSNPTGPGPLTPVEEPLPPPVLNTAIDGPACVDGPGTYTFSAVVDPWSPAYTYAWLRGDGTDKRSIGIEQRARVAIAKGTDEVTLELRVSGPGGARGTAEMTVRVRSPTTAALLALGTAGPLSCDDEGSGGPVEK